MTTSTLDLLALYDAHERCAATFPGMRREELPTLVRHVDEVGSSSIVLSSSLSSTTVEAAIQAQVAYFHALGHDLEWKAYAHDQPADLVDRLARYGFALDEREAILVLDVSASLLRPAATAQVRRISAADELRDVGAVWQRAHAARNPAELVNRLAYELEHTPEGLSVYLAELDGAPAACGWIRFRDASPFASLWGGSTAPELRNRGLYTQLLGVRVEEARRRQFRYVTVDARSTSRPILEKRGFQLLTSATACTIAADTSVE